MRLCSAQLSCAHLPGVLGLHGKPGVLGLQGKQQWEEFSPLPPEYQKELILRNFRRHIMYSPPELSYRRRTASASVGVKTASQKAGRSAEAPEEQNAHVHEPERDPGACP